AELTQLQRAGLGKVHDGQGRESMKITKETLDELRAIQNAHPDGRLTASDVLARAADEASPLHAHFTWDDTEAAERYRRLQAAHLIVSVRVTKPTASGGQVRVRAYVSMASDRITGGGYRPLETVIADASGREEVLRT